MRIQETDQILKEARYTRHSNAIHQNDSGVVSRAWKSITDKITSMFKR
jgi:hypothetical protein